MKKLTTTANVNMRYMKIMNIDICFKFQTIKKIENIVLNFSKQIHFALDSF